MAVGDKGVERQAFGRCRKKTQALKCPPKPLRAANCRSRVRDGIHRWAVVERDQRLDASDLGKKIRIVQKTQAELLKRFAQLTSSLPGRFMFDSRAVTRAAGLMICEERMPLREQRSEAVVQHVDS